MKLSELIRLALPDCGTEIDCQTEIGYIETNNESAIKRKSENPLFVCICGNRYDTHRDIDKLILAGIKYFVVNKNQQNCNSRCEACFIEVEDTRRALALLARAFFGFPDLELFTVGITGTKGKTTVTYMLRSVFEENPYKCGIIGSNGIIYDGKVIQTENSTPAPLQFYGALRDMADLGVTHVFCEVTSQALKQYRTYGTVFDVGVFTNLFPDHIGADEHESFDEYKNCKGMLFTQCKKAVLNIDCPHYCYFSDICKREGIEYTSYSVLGNDANVVCDGVEIFDDCSRFNVDGKEFFVPLPGEFNISNALCSVAIAKTCGLPVNSVARGLKKVTVYGRCEKVPNPGGVNIIIDYAHSKESLENILRSLKKICKGKLYCVFGAGGNRSKLRRVGMGQAASEYADFSVITSDNPRHESLESIIADIISGMNCINNNYTIVPDRKKAIFTALSMARKGDTVLLAGKGGQKYEEIGDEKKYFDEREVVEEYYSYSD